MHLENEGPAPKPSPSRAIAQAWEGRWGPLGTLLLSKLCRDSAMKLLSPGRATLCPALVPPTSRGSRHHRLPREPRDSSLFSGKRFP